MAVIRKAAAYTKRKSTPYTRKSKKKSKNYIKTVPPNKIVKFEMGNIKKFNEGRFKYQITISSKINAQIRDLALEAVRQTIHGKLQRKLLSNFYFSCKTYPHQILRDNKTFSGGTKGERVQTGMRHSFGSTGGRAARVKVGQTLFIIAYPNKKDTDFIRALCKSAVPKLPVKTGIVYSEKEE